MYTLGQDISPDQAMRFAIETAKMGRGMVSPNPLVGCVIVDKDHKFLSSGAHMIHGGAHAEIAAIKNLSGPEQLKEATLYVTLEPCSHQGKTGSCAEVLKKVPFKSIRYGLVDPNPEVSGRGIELLRINKQKVEPFGRYENELRELSEQFLYHIENRMPFISLKVGTSLDGMIALKTGESQWITEEDARLHARQTRAHYDATLIGAGTLKYDNPSLDFRETGFEGKKKNKIILLDPRGTGADEFKASKISKLHDPKNIFVLTRSEHLDKWAPNLVHTVQWDSSGSGWRQALKNLYNKDIYSIFVEGGSYVFGQMLSFGLAQKLYMYQSSKILGDGISWTQHFSNHSLDLVPSLHKWNAVSVGRDRLNTAYF